METLLSRNDREEIYRTLNPKNEDWFREYLQTVSDEALLELLGGGGGEMEGREKISKKDQEEVRAISAVLSQEENIFKVVPVDVLGIMLKDFGIKALGYALRTNKWFKEKSPAIIAAIFNKRHAHESWDLYVKDRPDNLFQKNPLKALQTYEIAKFFLGDKYFGGQAQFTNKSKKDIFLNDQSDDISEERVVGLFPNDDYDKVDQWLKLSYSGYKKKYIKLGGKKEMYYHVVGVPRSVQNLIFYIIYNGYQIQNLQDFNEYTGKTWTSKENGKTHKSEREVPKERFAHIFSCVACGIDFVYGKCEECAQSYCSDACHTYDHKNGCKTKIK